jgi:hypothetical protein
MKFIKLESRGGNYLVVAENVAWLRSAENGQTNVGIVGGQPLLVVGSIEEVAAKILAEVAEGEETAAPQPATPAPAPASEQEPVRAAIPPAPEPAPPAPAPAPARAAAAVAADPRPIVKPGMTLSERVAAAAAPKLKPGTQRHMGALE